MIIIKVTIPHPKIQIKVLKTKKLGPKPLKETYTEAILTFV